MTDGRCIHIYNGKSQLTSFVWGSLRLAPMIHKANSISSCLHAVKCTHLRTHFTMNALECRTLTATCMHDSCAVYSMAHCVWLFNIRSIELHTLHLNMVVVGWCYSLGDLGLEGRHLKASVIYLNWIMYLRATACLHCHCIDNWPTKHRMAINHVAEVGAM